MRHEPKSTDFKWELMLSEPPRSVEVRRVPCSCGWAGKWCESVEAAIASFDWHVKQATKAEELARFVGPEPAVYADGEPEAL